MSSYAPYRRRTPDRGVRGRRSTPREWRWSDRLALVAAWGTGLFLCLVAGAIVIYMAVRGVQYLRPSMLVEHTNPSVNQAESGGFLDPIDCRLDQNAGQLPRRVPFKGPPGWIGRTLVHACALQRQAVGHREVTDGAQIDRIVRRSAVDFLPGQIALLGEL